MANLIIKPTSGGSLILQDEGGTAANTIDASGNTQLAGTLGVTGNATLSGTANNVGTVTAGTLGTAVVNANAPKLVFNGWNASNNTSTGTQEWDLGSIETALETDYMTSAGSSPKVFTVVKAGTYFIHVKCMSQLDEDDYAHHQLKYNGTVMYATHGYGGYSTNTWMDYVLSHVLPMSVSDTLSGQTVSTSGVAYTWYGGHYHSEFTITYLGPIAA